MYICIVALTIENCQRQLIHSKPLPNVGVLLFRSIDSGKEKMFSGVWGKAPSHWRTPKFSHTVPHFLSINNPFSLFCLLSAFRFFLSYYAVCLAIVGFHGLLYIFFTNFFISFLYFLNSFSTSLWVQPPFFRVVAIRLSSATGGSLRGCVFFMVILLQLPLEAGKLCTYHC